DARPALPGRAPAGAPPEHRLLPQPLRPGPRLTADRQPAGRRQRALPAAALTAGRAAAGTLAGPFEPRARRPGFRLPEKDGPWDARSAGELCDFAPAARVGIGERLRNHRELRAILLELLLRHG